MITEVLNKIIQRDLQKLKSEIESYKDESNLWQIEKNISNSAGNLCLHLVGNLNTYIGATLGQTGYVRDRDAEFLLKNIPRKELIQKIEDTISVVSKVLPTLDDDTIQKEYPLLVLKEKTSTEYFLIHLTTHLGYHLGQVNYHRRLLD
ncbi:MAG TPA: DUF1572 family protein [Cyclobacteriaceae bacterium]|nr:DUF1572 family protein [Cyclobacteriaceae bacterium]HPW60746.1 DUF1572 family protein [Cyclobacteriaceae bacterium]